MLCNAEIQDPEFIGTNTTEIVIELNGDEYKLLWSLNTHIPQQCPHSLQNVKWGENMNICLWILIPWIVAFLSPCIIIQTTWIIWKVACHEYWQQDCVLASFVWGRFV